MLADRRAAIEGAGLPLAEGLALEHRLGREVLDVAVRGARPLRRRRGPPRRRRLSCGSGSLDAETPAHLVLGRFGAEVGHQHGEDEVGQDPPRSSGPRPARISSKIIEVAAADREAGGVGWAGLPLGRELRPSSRKGVKRARSPGSGPARSSPAAVTSTIVIRAMSASAASSSTIARRAATIRSGQGSPAALSIGRGDVGDEDVG